MIADEWHIYGRSDPKNVSNRLRQIWRLTGKAAFVCQMSGTLFPRGPRQEAEAIMQNLGGSWDEAPLRNAPPFSKWNDEQKRQLRFMFEKVGGRRKRWSALLFRRFIGAFYLRRTRSSQWESKPIVDLKFSLPIPLVLDVPKGCPIEARASASFDLRRITTNKGAFDLNKFKQNATAIRQKAWSDLFDQYNRPNLTTVQKERVLIDGFDSAEPSYRLACLVELLKKIKAKGEKFLIASDRLFLVRLAVLVCHFLFGISRLTYTGM